MLLASMFVSCGGPPSQAGFVRELERHFTTLNAEGLSRRDRLAEQLRAYENNPAGTPPTGIQYNSFHFDDKGWIAYDLRCAEKQCGQLYVVVDYYGRKLTCSRCGSTLLKEKPKDSGEVSAWLKAETKADVKPMFEVLAKSSPWKAKVRYIRRSWVYDPRGRSEIDVNKIGEKWKGDIKVDYLPGVADAEGKVRVPVGFHRPDAVFVAEQDFEYDGKSVKPAGPPREEPVRGWIEMRNVRIDPIPVR